MRMHNVFIAVAALAGAAATSAEEPSWDVAANLDLEARYFTQDARWAGQDGDAG